MLISYMKKVHHWKTADLNQFTNVLYTVVIKRVHSIKFQSLAPPNGLIRNLSRPYEGRRHDITVLHESRSLNDLRRFAWYNNQPLCIYGDPVYQLSVHRQAPNRQAQNNQDMINYNKAMSEVRVTVEWLFGNIKNYFKFIDFKKKNETLLKPCRKGLCSMYITSKCSYLSIWKSGIYLFWYGSYKLTRMFFMNDCYNSCISFRFNWNVVKIAVVARCHGK